MKGNKSNASDATKDETRKAKKEFKIAIDFNGITKYVPGIIVHLLKFNCMQDHPVLLRQFGQIITKFVHPF